MCIARQRPAKRPVGTKTLRSAPVVAATTISSPASEPKPMRPFVPVMPRPNGSRAPISATLPSETLMLMCSSRKPSEATAVARWTPWANSRCLGESNSRSVAIRPQTTAPDSDRSDSTPAPKSMNARKASPPTTASTGITTSAATVTPPWTLRRVPGFRADEASGLR